MRLMMMINLTISEKEQAPSKIKLSEILMDQSWVSWPRTGVPGCHLDEKSVFIKNIIKRDNQQ